MLVQVLSVTTHGDKKRTTRLTDIGRRRTDLVPVGRVGSKPICIHWQRQQAAVAVVGVDGRGRRSTKAGWVAGLIGFAVKGSLEAVHQAAISGTLNQKLLRNGLEKRNELRICTSGTLPGHVTSRAVS